MRIVLDTNCLLMSVPPRSNFYWLWQAFRKGKFTLCYTTEILNEYLEILLKYFSLQFADLVIEAIIHAPNSAPIEVWYNWQLISTDPDDNKFVDCAVSANASYIVTNDHHFNILKTIGFPIVSIKTIDEFQKLV